MNISNAVVEVTPDTFQTEVIERSKQMPVVLLFWAQQVAPAAQARTQLMSLVAHYEGKVCLALVDVAVDKTLAQHLRVQGLPSIRIVHEGQLADQLDGPQTDEVYRELLDRLTLSSVDMLKEDLDHYLTIGDWDSALQILQQAINDEPANQSFKVELADVLVCTGDLDAARSVIGDLPEDAPGRERPVSRLDLITEASGYGEVSELMNTLQATPADLQTTYQLAVRLAALTQFEEALDLAMQILRTDRTFREDIGRLLMLRIFSVLGKGSELAQQYRRRMFALMH
ncbi:MAG: tetratricopeptide repeat protein [Proteobacteria bacterium]|nr:tetratricopeptide repeat protein [Pseudomonadota bacterium]